MKRIASAEPINRLAAIVTSKGTQFKPTSKPSNYDVRDVQPVLKPWAETTGEDLTGRKFGRFAVVGYSAEKPARWVVRCQCGLYEFRTSKSVKNPNNDTDRCQDCRATFYIVNKRSIND